MNAAEFVIAGKAAHRIAICTTERDFTYGELQASSCKFAALLLKAGGRKGDRLILLSGNSFEWAAAYLGALKAGLVCVPLPERISTADLEYILQTTGAGFSFLQDRIAGKYQATLALFAVRVFCDFDLQIGRADDTATAPPHVQTQPDDLAALMFTSGSTGRPRGVMVSHGNIVANTASIIEAVHLLESDRVMTVLPFHYCFGTSLLHTYLRVGATLVIDTRFTYPEVVLRRMEETECTTFAGVPSHYQILLRNSSFAKRSFPHLRSLLQAGGHLAPPFVRQLREALPHAEIYLMYGQTEATARLACLPPKFLLSKEGSIGKAIPGVTLEVLREDGSAAAPGELGELVAEGKNITQGYWHSPQETALSFRGGKLHTGDMAVADTDGFLFIVDRAKEFIKCGGTRTSCRQIEDQILECEEIVEACVVGVADDVLGEAVRAFVVPLQAETQGLEARLRAFCKTRLAPPLVPREIVVVNALPKNSAGKVLRSELKSRQIPVSAGCAPEMAAAQK